MHRKSASTPEALRKSLRSATNTESPDTLGFGVIALGLCPAHSPSAALLVGIERADRCRLEIVPSLFLKFVAVFLGNETVAGHNSKHPSHQKPAAKHDL